jgi:mannose-6-phosphate isomerase-like protein (cupin superfamily)
MIRRACDGRTEIREKMRGGAGAVTIRHYVEKDAFTADTRLCAHLTLPPGTGIGMHQHEKEDEVFIIVRGTGILNDGKRETAVSAGDAVLTGGGESHAIRNDGNENLEIVAVIMCYRS